MIDKITNLPVSFKDSSIQPEKEISKNNTSDNSKKIEEIAKLTAAVFSATLVAVGGIALADKIITKKINTLPFGIKRGDISDELFNFLKRLGKESVFLEDLNKEKIQTLNNVLDDKTSSAFKKLVKSNKINTDEVIESVKALNEYNIEFIDEIIEKINSTRTSFKENIFSRLLKSINGDNRKYTSSLISMAKDIRPFEDNKVPWNESLSDILGFINKENEESFGVIFNSRKKGIESDFNFEELKYYTNLLQEHKNPESAKLFAGLKSSNGVDYLLSKIKEEGFENSDLSNAIKMANDDLIEIYYRLYSNCKKAECIDFLPYINKDNETFASEILNFVETSKYLHSNSIEQLKTILQSVDKGDSDLSEYIIKSISEDSWNIDVLAKILEKTKGNPVNTKKLMDYFKNNDEIRTNGLWKILTEMV